jgi:hypothetical protein
MRFRMSAARAMSSAIVALAATAILAPQASAIGLLKFNQRPMKGVVINQQQYWGHDEVSQLLGVKLAPNVDPTRYQGRAMADDFSDYINQPIKEIRWWGSYMNMMELPPGGVQKFLIAIESDQPVDPSVDPPILFSRPRDVLWSQIVVREAAPTPGPVAPGTFREKLVPPGVITPPGPAESLYEYDAELNPIPFGLFPQQENTVYWLKIAALVDVPDDGTQPPFWWGWHNRDYTVRDRYAVAANERPVGVIPDPAGGNPTPIWHHQDDTVSCATGVNILPGPNGMELLIEQTDYRPHQYIDFADGPGPMAFENFPGIGQYSKDLAFAVIAPPPSVVGDCDLDGDVDLNDLSAFSDGWYGVRPPDWGTGDFDADDDVDLEDLNLFSDGWYGPWGPGGGGTPEPSTIAMMILGAVCLVGYRLRR